MACYVSVVVIRRFWRSAMQILDDDLKTSVLLGTQQKVATKCTTTTIYSKKNVTAGQFVLSTQAQNCLEIRAQE